MLDLRNLAGRSRQPYLTRRQNIVSKSMGIAGPGIEPASVGATAQEQPPLRYQSPAHCDLYATL